MASNILHLPDVNVTISGDEPSLCSFCTDTIFLKGCWIYCTETGDLCVDKWSGFVEIVTNLQNKRSGGRNSILLDIMQIYSNGHVKQINQNQHLLSCDILKCQDN